MLLFVRKITMRSIRLIKINIICLALLSSFMSESMASSQTASNRVTIEVPPYLFIDSDRQNLTLSFSGYDSGSETNAQQVVYTVTGNGMSQSEGAPAIIAQLDNEFPDIEFMVQVGPFIRDGGNTELHPSSSGFVAVDTSTTALANKANSTGDGKLLRGRITMTYKAVAQSTLSSGEYSRQLIITLTDV